MAFDESLHPRSIDGRFTRGGAGVRVTSSRRGGDTVTETRPTAARQAGTPARIPAATFEDTVPPGRRLYRGIRSGDDGARHTLAGGLGGGDFGPGVYLGRSIAVAQGYAQQDGGDRGGRVLRATIAPGARVIAPPPKVDRRGGSQVAQWAADNDVDVIDLGNYQVVRNPAVLTFDEHAYTLDESVVLDHLAGGYPLATLPDQYQPIARRLGLA